MKVLNFVRPENGLTEDPLYYMNFEKYENVARDCYFFMADFCKDLYSGRYNDKEKAVLCLEEPNFCVGDGELAQLHEHADVIYTLCPFTASLFDNRQEVFFPFSEDYIPPIMDKVIDVCYFGSLPTAVPWDKYLTNVAFKYNWRFGNYNMGNVPKSSYIQKIAMMASSKVTLVHGMCNINPSTKDRYMSFPRGRENQAFTHIDAGMVPQIKSRMFEAAFSKCLMLCQRDPWNVIERWFTPDQEFIYFDDEADLSIKMDHILNHYCEFDEIRNNAYNRAMNNYTTKHFVDRFLI